MMAQRSVDVLETPHPWEITESHSYYTQVALWEQIAPDPWRMWKLIPVQDENPQAGSEINKYDPPPMYSPK